MFKKISPFIIGAATLFTLAHPLTIYAEEANEVAKPSEGIILEDKSEVSDLFKDFIDKAFSDTKGLLVKDTEGTDITDNFIDETLVLYSQEDYSSIHDIIQDGNLEISHGIEYPALSFESLENAQSRNSIQSIQGRAVSRDFYETRQDRNKRYPTKEWIVTVSSNFSYDTRTFNITSVGNTNIRIKTAYFGAAFSPYLDRVNATSSKNGRTARFDASYDMKATVSTLLVRETADYGRHTHTITTGANQ